MSTPFDSETTADGTTPAIGRPAASAAAARVVDCALQSGGHRGFGGGPEADGERLPRPTGARPRPRQPFAEPAPCPRQAALERPDRAAQAPPGRLLVAPTLQVAEHDRQAMALGEPPQLVGEDRPEVVAVAGSFSGEKPRPVLLAQPPVAGSERPRGPDRGAAGDPVEPRPERVLDPQGPRPAGQGEERGLEGVLRLLLVAEDRPADAEHPRPVPPDDRRRTPARPARRPGRRTVPGAARRSTRRRSPRRRARRGRSVRLRNLAMSPARPLKELRRLYRE